MCERIYFAIDSVTIGLCQRKNARASESLMLHAKFEYHRTCGSGEEF